ncbi:MAG: hypothetical protein F4X36_00190 [Gammaproteobacteria bacterium]|nr:hypothetical protein [Gammaproteobacteria bacterium]
MTDLREIVDVRGPGQPSEFVCEATVGGDVLAASGLPEGEILRRAAEAVEFELGMAEIHAGTAAGVDHAVFPLRGGALARARLDRSPSPSVAVRLA